MNADRLMRKGRRILFREDLGKYLRKVATIIGNATTFEDLGQPLVVLDCLNALEHETNKLVLEWYQLPGLKRKEGD